MRVIMREYTVLVLTMRSYSACLYSLIYYSLLPHPPFSLSLSLSLLLSPSPSLSAHIQIVTDALVKPPNPGDPSYDIHTKEKRAVLDSLSRKAKMVHERMNQIIGIQCNKVQGAMYAFPRVDIPEEAWEDAKVSHSSEHALKFHLRAMYIMHMRV